MLWARRGWERRQIQDIIREARGIQAYMKGYLEGLKDSVDPDESEDPDEEV